MGNNSCANNVPPVHAAHYRMFSSHDLSGSPGMNITIVKARGLRPPAEAAGRRPAGHRPTGSPEALVFQTWRQTSHSYLSICRTIGPRPAAAGASVGTSSQSVSVRRAAPVHPQMGQRNESLIPSSHIATVWYATTRPMPRRRSRFHSNCCAGSRAVARVRSCQAGGRRGNRHDQPTSSSAPAKLASPSLGHPALG